VPPDITCYNITSFGHCVLWFGVEAKESLLSAVARASPERATFGGDEGRPQADEAILPLAGY